jgi:hypothetical protein
VAHKTEDDLARQQKFLENLDDKYVACRQQHVLPRLAFTKSGTIPAGIRVVGPYRDGTFDLIRVCACGMEVSLFTGKGGRLIEDKPRRRYPKGYLAKGIGRIHPGMARQEGLDRIGDVLFANATPAPEEESAE